MMKKVMSLTPGRVAIKWLLSGPRVPATHKTMSLNSLIYLFTTKHDQTMDPATEHVLPRSQSVIVCRPRLSCRPTTVNTVTWQQPSPGLWQLLLGLLVTTFGT